MKLMNRYVEIWMVLASVGTFLIQDSASGALQLLAAPPSEHQSTEVKLGIFRDANTSIQPFLSRSDLGGLEEFARQTYADWISADPNIYSSLMLKVANAFDRFPIPNDASKRLALEFLELSTRRTAELEVPDELWELMRMRQNWDKVAKVIPSEVGAMRENYAARMLTAWQRAEEAWDQIEDRPLIMPLSTDNLIRVRQFAPDVSGALPTVDPIPIPEERALEETQLRTRQETARKYDFHVGLMNKRGDYTNVVAGNLAGAFSQIPQDFGRLATLTEQHLKKPESRDAFYAAAARGLPAHLVPQFQSIVRETQERRKAHLRTPGAPLIREHTNRPFASPSARGGNSVPNQTAGKPTPAVKPPIIAAASPDPAANETTPSAPPRSPPYLPLAGVLAAGLVLWWFISRSRPG